MFRRRAAFVLIGLFSLYGSNAAYAESEDFDDRSSFTESSDDKDFFTKESPDRDSFAAEHDGVSLEAARWEFGLHFGVAKPIGNRSISIAADNAVFLNSDPDFPGEDEFAENFLPTPDFTGKTILQGDLQQSYLVGAHVYYKVAPWLSAGVDGSYAIEDEIHVASGGPFEVPIYNTHYRAHGAQAALALRLGGWLGRIRPYVMGGAGPYWMSQSVTADLNDPDDPHHSPLEAASSSDLYASILYGGGVDFRCFQEGSMGLGAQIQRVFSPGQNRQFLIPTMRFDYHF